MKTFYLGAAFAVCMMCLHQDYLGKTAYLHRVEAHWVDIDWGWWLVPIIIILIWSAVLEHRTK